MTKVRFTFVDVQGNPLPGMEFKLLLRRASFNIEDVGVTLPEELVVTTDEQGKALVDLWPLKAAYRIQIAEEFEEICGKLNWSFYVPHSDEIIEAQTLFLVPPPTNIPWDEAALGKITQAVQDTHNDALSAAGSAAEAANSAVSADSSKNTAANSAANALASQQAATGSASAAATSATNASNKANESAASAAASLASKNESASSAAASLQSASEALVYRNTAAGSATAAANSAAEALASKNAAATSASGAANSAGTATTKASEASTSATTATTQAGVATTQAGTATTQANRAKTEADRATAATDGKQPLNGNLTALAAQSSLADSFAFFTGPSAMTTTPLTTQGRVMLAQATAAGMRTALGLDSAATYPVISSFNDPTPGRITSVGYAGIGRQLSTRNLPTGGSNRHDVIVRGMGFNVDLISGGDKPPEVVDGPMITMDYDGIQGVNVLFDWRYGTIYTFTDITPAPVKKWRMHYHEDNIVGTMANKAIIERGSNTNGSYTRYADGTQICSGSFKGYLGSTTYELAFAAPFVAGVDVCVSGTVVPSALYDYAWAMWSGNPAVWNFTSTSTAQNTVQCIAVGRWK